MEEVDDFEADLEAVDVVSFALAVVVSLGSNAVVSGSILVATATVTRRRGVLQYNLNRSLPRSEGAYAVSNDATN